MTELKKWSNKQSVEGKQLIIGIPMALHPTVSRKSGKTFNGVAQIGSAFGGETIGFDDKGREVKLKVSVWLKDPTEVAVNSKFELV